MPQYRARGASGRWAAVEIRRRWRALVALGLLAGLTAGLALAATAGARRTATAWDRLRSTTQAADAIVFTSQAGIFDPAELDYGTFDDLDFIEDVGAFGIAWGTSDVGDFGGFVSTSGDWLEGFDVPRLIEGRLPDPSVPTEAVMSRPLPGGPAEEANLRLGSTVTVSFFTVEQQVAGRFETPEGPTVPIRIVGISDSPFNLVAIPSDGDIYLGPAFREEYGDGLTAFSNLVVRLEDPARDLPALEAEVERKYPGRSVPVYDLQAAGKRVTTATSLERSGLLLFALAVALAGIVIVGQALTRSVRAAGTDVGTLVALGFSRGDAIRALVTSHAPAIATAAVASVGTAVALSPRFPIGLGRRVEVDPGVHVDALVLVSGAVALAAVLVLAVGVTASRVSRSAVARERATARRFVERLRTGLPPVVATGVSLALEAGKGQRTLPTRPAVAGAIVGVVGVLGAMTLSDGIGDAIANPARFGAVWDAEAFFTGEGPAESVLAMPERFAEDEDVSAAARFARVTLPVDGVVLPTYALDSIRGSIHFVVIEGRAPDRGEVVLGPDSARALDVDIGDHVSVGELRDVEVVGLGLMPTTAHSSFDQGAWVSARDIGVAIAPSQFASLREQFSSVGLPESVPESEYPFLQGGVFVRFAQGVDRTQLIERLGGMLEGIAVEEASGPADQANLRNVRPLPTLFSGFATVLAVAAIAHVSSSVVRRRRTDLAVLRAIGFTPRQARWCIGWQATTLAVIGLAVGAPLGVIVGRVGWRSVANATPMIYVAPLALTALLLAGPAAIVAANALAAWPARVAARLRPAEALRAE